MSDNSGSNGSEPKPDIEIIIVIGTGK